MSNSILSINNWSYCSDGFVYAGPPSGLPVGASCVTAASALARALFAGRRRRSSSLVCLLFGRDLLGRHVHASKFRAISTQP
ncbi:hypothetical protein T4B_4955 [Trichinella pseudospiralis]|uniref:Uncharacterized protein n=1 Tax=Trichinella pseudospiralis TaxID=6337 RepID=A0A0V1IN69_TRIPS|nr:hypothetical protein T4B_4955 [Trichinella pseudospiralis]